MKTETKPSSKYSVANSLVSYYLAIMLSFFPLFLTEQYVHARTDKFWFYMILSAILVISVAVCMLISRSESKRTGDDVRLFLPLTVTDIMMLCFLGFAAVSTLLSPYGNAALTGSGGRDNGLLLLMMYTLVYFTITRNYVYKDYVIGGYLIFSMLVALLAVLNFYNIDPIDIYSGYDEATIQDFGSTIGNKNMIAAFMCMYLPAAMMTFTVTEQKALRIIAGFATGFAYMGLLCADSTSDILGLIVILPIMLIFAARKAVYLQRYLFALTVMFTSGKVLQLFAVLTGDNNKGFEFMQDFLIYSPMMWIAFAVCGTLYLIVRFTVNEERYPAEGMQAVFIILFGAGVVAALGAFTYFSVIDTESDLGSFEKLLRFSDAWGTHRGYMWRISLEEYANLDPLHKLFGSGPDTLYYVFEPHFGELLREFGDSSTDAAHNEFINYLVTQGALGLLAYLGAAGCAVIRGIKAAKRQPIALIFVSSMLCYLAQSTVNLYTPIVTPLFFLFLSLAEASSKNEELEVRS